jgi:hypothetical protein
MNRLISAIKKIISYQFQETNRDLARDNELVPLHIPRAIAATKYTTSLLENRLPIVPHNYSKLGNLFNPANSNTWEYPLKYGASFHLVKAYELALTSMPNILSIFSSTNRDKITHQKKSIDKYLAIYFSMHDSKDASIFTALDLKTRKSKAVENMMTKIKLAKLILGVDLPVTKELVEFAKKNPACLYSDQKQAKQEHTEANIDKINTSLAKFNSDIDKQIKIKLSESKDADASLFNFMTILVTDSIGMDGVVKYSMKKTDAERDTVVTETKKTLDEQYNSLAPTIKDDISKESFMAIQAAKFIGDVKYYANLGIMLFNNDNNLEPDYKNALKLILEDSESQNKEMPAISVKIKTGLKTESGEDEIMKIPALPSNWDNKSAPQYHAGISYAKAMVDTSAAYMDVYPLIEEISQVQKGNTSNEQGINGSKNGIKFSSGIPQRSTALNQAQTQEIFDNMKHMVSSDFFINRTVA